LFFNFLFAIYSSISCRKSEKCTTLYGNNFTKLHEIIDPTVLPPLYGGTGKTLDEMMVWWQDKICI